MVQVMLNGVPLEEYTSDENFRQEVKEKPKTYRKPCAKHCRRAERPGKVKIWTREEIRAAYGVDSCPYTWEGEYHYKL